ncbi:mannose-1-phosphate guanylyltransferase / phosphomannomutase [Clostridium acidisoli DSM 12555]|uniref:Mannose-1-phosphate guanylyltransferase / phosphomannomutase n=1 Tax=Clostridium acidisoli DSM 12555 TaxID=1121291 RepID=A0A1W1XSD4_9CLOT|nr:sugar phosphate nucleotidyltransferase [Clostridium acidisoli]SMC26461.1 mannose-1-phosphate guanylyltransferase / phosphomannomutase [Clostridium acidisoli DSM 12555]
MKGIIMAGGQGTRLRPLTCNIPKPMIPLIGKPVIQYAIELLRDSGIQEIGITVQYLADEIINYFGDGSQLGVNLQYFTEEIPMGTAGSVKNAEEFLNETFIVVSGDAITDINLNEALKFHNKKAGVGTLILKEVDVPLEYGVVVTDDDDKITEFLEKPSWSEVFSDKVNTGIYILEPQIFNYYEKNEKFDFSNDLFPILMKDNMCLYGYVADCYWCDIGSIDQFMKCNYDILNKKVNVKILGNEVRKGVWIGDNCSISPSVKINPPVYIGDNTEVYEDAEVGPLSVIGKDNIISDRSTIKRSVIFDNCYISKNVEARAALISNKVQLESWVSVFEEAAIGDESIIGKRSVIKPKAKIWPNKIVGNSETVRGNLIWGGKYQKSFFGQKGITGEVNVDITPEFVSKLASAYASILSHDAKVAVSCSEDNVAKMLKQSLKAGLMAIGIQVCDLLNTTLQVTRKATAFLSFNGSIHIHTDKADNQIVNIVFMDADGLNIEKVMKKKIENKFKREDFRRVRAENIKNAVELNDIMALYTKNILNKLQTSSIKKGNYSIVFVAESNIVGSIMKYMFKELNIAFSVYENGHDLKGLSKTVKDTKSNLGMWISDEADNYVFIDEKGNIIKDEVKEAIKALVLLNIFKFKTIVTSVDASYSVERLADMYNAKFIRTKLEERNIIDEYIKNEVDKDKKYIINAYLLITDAVSMSVLLIDLITRFKSTLSYIIDMIPQYHMKYLEIACPWELKGKVMRNIIEKCDDFSCVDLIEGVRLNYHQCWALIMPDLNEPFCKVYTESEKEEDAEKALKELSFNIEKIIRY